MIRPSEDPRPRLRLRVYISMCRELVHFECKVVDNVSIRMKSLLS